MKKAIIIFVSIMMPCMLLNAAQMRIEARAGYFTPSESVFKDIYDKGWMWGGEIGLDGKLSEIHGIEPWFKVKYYSKEGELTFTKEETKLRIVTYSAGVNYKLNAYKGILYPYVGLGLNYNDFKESNVFGEVLGSEWGYEGQLGFYIEPSRSESGGLIINLNLNYSYCNMMPEDIEFNIGGITLGIGLGYKF